MFVVYAIALTTGTHWPSLRFGPEVPASDKVFHLVGFGLLAWLIWRTGWFRSRVVALLVALVWSALDELSQALPFLGRHPGGLDMTANALGVLVAGAAMWACAPCGGRANRERIAIDAAAFERAFAGAAMLPFAGLFALAIIHFVTMRSIDVDSAVARRLIIGGLAAIGVIGLIAAFLRFNTVRARMLRDEPDRWGRVAPPARRTVLSIASVPVIAGFLALGGLFALIHLATWVYVELADQTSIARAGTFVARLPPELTGVVDLSVVLILASVLVGTFRRRLARFHDRGEICRRCGHDLRGTPAPDGVGRCNECGATFDRSGS